jgi:hypothetical protein
MAWAAESHAHSARRSSAESSLEDEKSILALKEHQKVEAISEFEQS